MDPSHEGDNEQFELSQREQENVVRNATSLDGIKDLNDSLRVGLLKDLIPIKVEDPKNFQPDEDSPYMEPEDRPSDTPEFHYNTRNSVDRRSFNTAVHVLDEDINYITIDGYRSIASDVEGEKGSGAEGYVDYAVAAETGEVVFDKAAFTVGHPTRNIVVTIGNEGHIVDVMPYNTFMLDDAYGAPRVPDDELRQRLQDPQVLAAADQLRATLKDEGGIKFADERTPLEFSEFHDYVAKLYGMSVEELFTKKIDVTATFNGMMNASVFDKKSVIEGEKAVPVVPLVFKEV